ncbi:cysteine desulfurase [uncultured Paenalcaligenes sp.]|uniref:cysteine desulfurase n=1 Tax=uncultured Paenalcaligenes sp. TaxID=1588925 RepID=UPI002620A3B1|nr:cysteine desulfurase [uncultured Paenalcaligenes sp.]
MVEPILKPAMQLDRRADFPILAQPVRGQRLVYLDNGATTQKPAAVIHAESHFYEHSNANIHRGVHWLSQHATDLYDQARVVTQQFLHAQRIEEIVFTSGTTDSINLIAYSWGMANLTAGDEIVLTGMEHHSNIVPWQLVAQKTGAIIKVVPVLDNGELDLTAYQTLLSNKTKFVGIVHVSNALGTVNPIAQMIEMAHQVGAKVLIDGAQAVAHTEVNVQELDCDFYVFSGHKIYGPTGTGVLYAKYDLLDAMPPWKGGGDMIHTVSFESSTYAPVPQRFEAGTPNIAGVVVLAEALKYVQTVGLDAIAAHEDALLRYATAQLGTMKGITLVGTAANKAGVLSFLVDDIHPHDLGTILDMDGVAIRAGHHCAMPLMTRFGIPGTARASFAVYNSFDDVDALVASLKKAQKLFGVADE